MEAYADGAKQLSDAESNAKPTSWSEMKLASWCLHTRTFSLYQGQNLLPGIQQRP